MGNGNCGPHHDHSRDPDLSGADAIEIEDVLATQRRIVRALHGRSADWRGVELTMAQLKTLVVLVDDGPYAIGEVAQALGVSLPNASHLVDRLVRLGLARRTEDAVDRRRTLASATPAGDELLRGLREGARDAMRAALRRLEPGDLAALRQGLAALARAIEAEDGVERASAAPARAPAAGALR